MIGPARHQSAALGMCTTQPAGTNCSSSSKSQLARQQHMAADTQQWNTSCCQERQTKEAAEEGVGGRKEGTLVPATHHRCCTYKAWKAPTTHHNPVAKMLALRWMPRTTKNTTTDKMGPGVSKHQGAHQGPSQSCWEFVPAWIYSQCTPATGLTANAFTMDLQHPCMHTMRDLQQPCMPIMRDLQHPRMPTRGTYSLHACPT